MKKLLSIMLAAILLLTCLAVPVYAEAPIEFELVITSGDYVHDGTGAEITADVVVSDIYAKGYTGAILNITIPDGLVLVNTADPSRSVKWSGEVLEYADFKLVGFVSGTTNVLALGYGIQSAFVENGVIATIRFVVADDATLIKNDFGIKLEVKDITPVEGNEHLSTDADFADYVTVPTAPVEAIDKEQAKKDCTHPVTEKTEAKPATCTEPGYSAGEKCTFCGAPIGETKVESALGHDFKDDKVLEEATCEKVGKMQQKCSRCGETKTVDIPKKDHVKSKDYKTDGTSHWLYCVNCGAEIEGTKEAHKPDTDWHSEDASVDGHYHVCSVCKAAVGVEEHVDKDADGECDVCKAALHEHVADTSKWISDEEGVYHYHACTVPGCKAQLDKTNHNLKVETKDATCTEKGTKTTTCADCGYEKTEELETIPHTPDTEWHTEKGSDKHWHICTVCGNKIEDTAVDHTYGEYTSTETEHTRTCTACGAVETGAHKESADYKSDETSHWHYCEVCGYEYEKVEHSSEKSIKCDAEGHWYECDTCGAKFKFDPHSEAYLIPAVEATEEADGYLAHWYCPDCDSYFYDNDGKVGAGPYDESEFTVKYNAGCDGNHLLVCVPVNEVCHMVVCERQCGYSVIQTHHYVNGVCIECGHVSLMGSVPSLGGSFYTGPVSAPAPAPSTTVTVETPTEGKICAEELC